jgi:hypothetical protein
MKTSISILITILILSCGIPESEHNQVKTENATLQEKIGLLEQQLDDCENGADKISGKIEKQYKEKNYVEAKRNIELLYNKFSESSKNKEYQKLLPGIEKEIKKEEKRKVAAEKERIRLENLNNTGIWTVNYYVDDFGEPTKKGYIRNLSLLKGSFSNTATQNSALNIKFLISNSSDISIMLYEYANNNPVKAYSSEGYRVLIQDNSGERLKLKATNYSDRLSFNKTNSRKVHNALMKGGTLKFKIYEIDTPTTEYNFTIQNADWYENAHAKLKG